MPIYQCKNCRDSFSAREADRKRGWARYCSKSCKAIAQTKRTGYAGPGTGPVNPIMGAWEDGK
jgi:hypothetical protein